MRPLQGTTLLLLTLAMAVTASVQSDSLPRIQYPETSYGHEAEERSWIVSQRKKSGEAAVEEVAAYAAVPKEEYQNGGWSAGRIDEGDVYQGNDAPWSMQISASESELRNIFSSERVRWMPSKSRFRPARRPQMDDEELPLHEHQMRQQQQRKGRPGFRPGTQLENLGGGMLADDDKDDDDDEEEEEDEEEGAAYSPPPRKRPTQRRPQEPSGGKPPTFADLKSILKSSGPSSLSEVLQRKNLSLDDFLKGGRNALSAITSLTNDAEKPQQPRRRRPVFSALVTRPPLIRRRTSTSTTTSTTSTTTTTTTSTTTAAPPVLQHTTKETKDEPEEPSSTATPRQSTEPPASGDPSRDILEIIWQDGDDEPSLAEVLSSRNMTVEDLIRQRQRASGRADITALFGEVEKEEGKTKAEEDRNGEEGRNFARFDLLETDWDQNHAEDEEDEPEVREPGEEDQVVTQSRNTYQFVTSVDGTVAPHDARISHPRLTASPEHSQLYRERTVGQQATVTKVVSPQEPPRSDNSIGDDKPKTQTNAQETKIAQSSGPTLSDGARYLDAYRPIVRSRLTTPSTREGAEAQVGQGPKEYDAPPAPSYDDVDSDYDDEGSKLGLPMGVKSAIIASSCLLGIALLIFLSIFVVFRYRQWRRRGGVGPYFCVAMMEAAAGDKKSKEPKIVKKEHSKDNGWSDTVDSAQARLWRTLRRGRCRFYDREREQM